jgi:hypothetical protein
MHATAVRTVHISIWRSAYAQAVLGVILGAGAVAALLLLRENAQAVIAWIPLADRQGVVMQASANVSPASVGTLLSHVQFLLLFAAGLSLGAALQVLQQTFLAANVRPLQCLCAWLLANPALVLSVLVVALGVYYTFQRSIVIEDVRYFYLDDDAMISMRYARNWASGLGLVWNPGERVEGYTNFLWTAVMTVIHKVGMGEDLTSAYVVAVNWALVIAIVWFVQAIMRWLMVHRLWVFAICLVVALDENMIQWSRSGLETILLTFLVVVCVWAVVSGRQRWFALSLSLVPLARSDAFVLAFALGVYYLWLNRRRWTSALLLLIVCTIPATVHLLFRYDYYGELLPNTYYLKVGGFESLWQIGLSYILRLIVSYPVVLLLALCALLLRRVDERIRLLPLVALTQIVYTVAIGGDTFWFLRPITPVLPLLYLSAGFVLNEITHTMRDEARLVIAAAVLFFVPAVAWEGQLFTSPSAEPDLFEGQTQVIGLLIERNTAPGTLISIEPAGTIPYFADQQRFVDALGKSDAHIARVAPYPGNTLIGHNKFDWDYVYRERQPDIVLMGCYNAIHMPEQPRSEWERLRADQQPNELPYITYQVLNDDFVSLYRPHQSFYLVPPQLEHDWILCPFSRAGVAYAPVWALATEAQTQAALEFDSAAFGAGWYPPDVWEDGRTVQWTGPQTRSTLYLTLDTGQTMRGELCLIPLQDELLSQFAISVNGEEIPYTRAESEDCTSAFFQFELTPAVLQRHSDYTELAFEVEQTIVPDSYMHNGDLRSIALAFDWLHLRRISPGE